MLTELNLHCFKKAISEEHGCDPHVRSVSPGACLFLFMFGFVCGDSLTQFCSQIQTKRAARQREGGVHAKDTQIESTVYLSILPLLFLRDCEENV